MEDGIIMSPYNLKKERVLAQFGKLLKRVEMAYNDNMSGFGSWKMLGSKRQFTFTADKSYLSGEIFLNKENEVEIIIKVDDSNFSKEILEQALIVFDNEMSNLFLEEILL